MIDFSNIKTAKIKQIRILLILTLFGASLFSCQDYSPDSPDACLSVAGLVNGELVEAETFKVGEQVIISSCSDADLYSVWTGDEGHEYSKKDERGTDDDGNTTWTNTGTNLGTKEGSTVVKMYEVPGTYTITLVATNTSKGSTDVEVLRSTAEKVITVTD